MVFTGKREIIGVFIAFLFHMNYCIDPVEFYHKNMECRDGCGETDKLRHMKNGSLICFWNPQETPLAETPCYFQCIGIEAPPDQTKCWCDLCKNEGSTWQTFCDAPYGKGIPTEDCEKSICSGNMGKLRYYNAWCTEGDEDRADFVKTLEKDYDV